MPISKDECKLAPTASENQPSQTTTPMPAPTKRGHDPKRYPDTKKWTDAEKEAYLEKNKPLIYSMVSQIQHIPDPAISQEDLFQEAQMAFWLAFDTYNPNRDTLFTTYAHKCMRNAINEKLRATAASKRRPKTPNIPYDSDTSEYGEEIMGGDNMEITASPLAGQQPPIEDTCVQNEVLEIVYKLLKTQFAPDEQKVFLALSQKQKTQLELAKEMGCSQAKISMMFKFVRIRLYYELKQAGFAEYPV